MKILGSSCLTARIGFHYLLIFIWPKDEAMFHIYLLECPFIVSNSLWESSIALERTYIRF